MSTAYREENGMGKVHSMFNPRRIAVTAKIEGPSMTREEFAEECDINTIMERYDSQKGWPLPPRDQEPIYYDFVGMPDLQSALHSLNEASEAFMTLPAKVRKEFDNDPVRFVEFASSRDNLEQLREWGLAEPEKVPEPPVRVEVTNAPSVAPKAPAEPKPA